MESSLVLTLMQIVTMADEECQILRHSNQWVETFDASIVAMQALFHQSVQGNNTPFEQLSTNLKN
jgi:hypothetical protein